MKVIQLHDRYRIRGGEDVMVDAIVSLLRRKGIDVRLMTHNSRNLETSLLARIKAFGSGIYSFSAAAAIKELIVRDRPDIVHVHNLHPLFSPSVLDVCRQSAVPVIMTCHNYRLVCPSGMHMRAGKLCELCLGRKEYWCALINCKGNVSQSISYALRNIVHRKLRLFAKNVSVFLAISQFVRDRLVESGLPRDRIVVVPNMVTLPDLAVDSSKGKYIAFAGRFTPEKGIDTLLKAARQANLPLKMAGDYSSMIQLVGTSSKMTSFVGSLSSTQMATFYRKARIVVVPSECLEPFGLVAAEAMSHGVPVIASRIGGLEEIVDDGVTGYLFEPANMDDLVNKLNMLWENPSMCRQMGLAGREKAAREYNESIYYERLMSVYENAIPINV